MHNFIVENVEPIVELFYKSDLDFQKLIPNILNYSGNSGRELMTVFYNFMEEAGIYKNSPNHAFVYAYEFEEKSGSLLKVGYSTNPKQRLSSLKTEAKKRFKAKYLEPVFFIPVVSEQKAEYLENEIHNSLPRDTIKSGEWYEGWFGNHKILNLWYMLSFYKGTRIKNAELV